MQWVESPVGCGLSDFFDALDVLAPGKFARATPPTQLQTDASFQEELVNGITLEMVHVSGGSFLMGSGRRFESPEHIVRVPAFCIGKYPVTQLQWKLVAAMPKERRDLELSPSAFKGDQLPVEQVSWQDAEEFCARLSQFTGRAYRLPSEAEWEYACRAGTTTAYSFGESISEGQVNCNGWHGQTTEVGHFPPNAFGLYDMHGNVWDSIWEHSFALC